MINKNFDREFDKRLLAEAVQIRTKLASNLAQSFLKEFNHERAHLDIRDSLFETLLERMPFKNCLLKLSFSQFITAKAVDKVLISNKSPIEKVGLVGYLIELSARVFINPEQPNKRDKNLAASKKYGYFFTPISLANEMSKLLFSSREDVSSILDPACGSGTLLAISLINNPKLQHIAGVEIDPFTSRVATKLLNRVSRDLKVHPKIKILNTDFLDFISQKTNQVFISNKVDGIIMNPPYGRIRFISSSLSNNETKVGLNNVGVAKLKNILRKKHIENAEEYREKFHDIGLGKATPEYSKLFIGSSIQFLRPKGKIVAITPNSWLSDKNGAGLRKYIFSNHGLREIWNFKETAKMFPGVNQPTSVVLISACESSNGIKIKADVESIEDLHKDIHDLDTDKIYKFSPSLLRIPRYGNSRGDLLAKIHMNKNLEKHREVLNLRGEFDLTFNKDLIVNSRQKTRLVRGDHIKQCFLKNPEDSEKAGYVNKEAFLKRIGNSAKRQHISNWRIALPQCTYMQKQKRIEACLVPPQNIIANSCNYIVLNQNQTQKEAMDTLLIYCAYLNSLVVEWRFRLFNSNNHIANYEINELPIVDIKEMQNGFKNNMLLKMKKYMKTRKETDLFNLEVLVAKSYNLSAKNFHTILEDLSLDQFKPMAALYNKN